ncbi:MAG: hypothetical protein JJ863_37805 [Deltaproteobacteria bacterium]|nr:hypothetical protein [Deltaproteobacteria bacterium]
MRAVIIATFALVALIACESDPRRRGPVDAAPAPRDAQPADFGPGLPDFGPRDLGGPVDLGRDLGQDFGVDFGIDSGSPTTLCTETCEYSNDGDCDDGGPGSDYSLCDLGTDCIDCGPR